MSHLFNKFYSFFVGRRLNEQNGNVLIIVLIAIALVAALSAAIQGTSNSGQHVDRETMLLRASQVRQYTSELERGVYYLMQNGISEGDIRFSYPLADSAYGDLDSDADKSDQLFAREGGGAQYQAPPRNVNNGDMWEFFGQTALPGVGSDAADLVAVLPNVSESFCKIVNESLGYVGQPRDTSACINADGNKRFGDMEQYASSPNTTEETSFSFTPAKQGCVQCTNDGSYHYFHVLIAR